MTRMTIVTFRVIARDNIMTSKSTGASKTTSPSTWTVAEAKAKFSEVIERAQSAGPQAITRNGRKAVVVVAAEEWERKTKRAGSLAEFFAASPLRGSGLKIRRVKDRPRVVDL
jgi:prevent-host-death family protein